MTRDETYLRRRRRRRSTTASRFKRRKAAGDISRASTAICRSRAGSRWRCKARGWPGSKCPARCSTRSASSWIRSRATKGLATPINSTRGATLPLTAEGLLCRQYLGWAHDDPRLRDGVDYLARQPAGLGQSQRVLLVLRHAGLPSHGRQGLAEVERGDAAAAAGAPGEAAAPNAAVGTRTATAGATPAGGSM